MTRIFMERDEHDFKGQLKYEHFQFFFRKHWVKFIQPIIFSAPVGLFILVVLVFLGRLTLLVEYEFVRAFYVYFTLLISIGYFFLVIPADHQFLL